MIVFSTVRSGSTFYLDNLAAANPDYKNFDEILHHKTFEEYDRYDGKKMCKLQSHHLMETDYNFTPYFKNNHVHVLFPRENYVEQYLSVILVNSIKYSGRWSKPEDLKLFDSIKISTNDAISTVNRMSMWLSDWCYLAEDIAQYHNYSIHRFEDFTKDNKTGRFWPSFEEKLKHIADIDAVTNYIHESYSKWNLSADLTGTKELLISNLPTK